MGSHCLCGLARTRNNGRGIKLQRLRTMHLFAGAGGGILADLLLGHQPVCAVEIDGYCQQVLSARQKDNCLPWFPIFGDVETFNGKPWRGIVDVLSGGFPCQDISTAGDGDGIDGERSGLWSQFARIIGEVRPSLVYLENSPALTVRGLGTVLGDLASLGFNATWGVLGADFAGFDHRRDRIWIVADSISNRLEGRDYSSEKRQRETAIRSMARLHQAGIRHDIPAPDSFGIANGLADRVDRLKAIGNGQVSAVAATAFNILRGKIDA